MERLIDLIEVQDEHAAEAHLSAFFARVDANLLSELEWVLEAASLGGSTRTTVATNEPRSLRFLVPVALCAAIAWLARGVFLGYPAKGVPTRNLSRKEQAILAAAADALFPPGGPIPLSGTDAGAIPYLDAYVGRVDRTQRALMRLLFQAVEHGAVAPRPAVLALHAARRGRSHRLPRQAREEQPLLSPGHRSSRSA